MAGRRSARPGGARGNSNGDLNHSNRPVRTRMPGGVGGVRSAMIGPYPDLMEDGRHDQALEYLKATPGLIDCTDAEGDTPLMKAVEAGNLEMVKHLLALNASVNIAAVDGFCAIHIAARKGRTTIAAKLLDAGADLESTTPHGWTPVMCAIQAEFEGCAKLLVRRGAKTNTAGPRGTPLEMARAVGMKLS